MADDVKYICLTNVNDRYRRMIPAGTPFIKERMVLHTFETLKSKNRIYEANSATPVNVMGGSKGKLLASIANTVPAAALNPPKLSPEDKERNARAAAVKAKEDKKTQAIKSAEKAADKVEKATTDLEEEKAAQEVLSEIEDATADSTPDTPDKPKSTIQQIWVADPEKIKGMKYEQLNSIYRTQCQEYNIPLEQISSKKLLIEKLSSQFIK